MIYIGICEKSEGKFARYTKIGIRKSWNNLALSTTRYDKFQQV